MARIEAGPDGYFKQSSFYLSGFLLGSIETYGNRAIRSTYGTEAWDTLKGRFSFHSDGVDGTVTGIESGDHGTLTFKISGLSLSYESVYSAIETTSYKDDLQLLKNALSGADVLIGGSFADGLSGYGGNDVITGKGGKDSLTGGDGADTFRFLHVSDSQVSAQDIIKDFRQGEDRIDLSRIDADQDGTSGNQAFKFIGAKPFSGRDGELRFKGGSVYGDVNGDRVADFAIKVAGLQALSADDFLL